MSKMSLTLPYLIYLSIGSIFVGVIIAPLFREMPQTHMANMQAMEMDAAAMHPTREVPADGAPSVDMSVIKDPVNGWTLTLTTENFTFAPLSAGSAALPNEGHAHLYVDDVKIARLYGPHFHIADLAPGQHDITVTLSSNDHAYLSVNGARIEARTVIVQGTPAGEGN